MADDLTFDYLNQLKKQSSALRLLGADHFPLLASFFYLAFIQKNRRAIPYQELIALLDHHLADIAETYGDKLYPKPAKAYIDDWINLKGGYLRKYLPQQGEEPECDLFPEVEKALRWLEELQGRRFVGTESRLKLVLQLLQDLVQGTSADKEAKLQALKQKKTELEQEIIAVEQGMDSGYSQTQVREHMYLVSDMSRQLIGDFRQVEANFRDLDKETRKKITVSGSKKGKLLDQVFSNQDVIDDSDEGKSFSAFFELLMTPDMRTTLRKNLKQLLSLEHSKEFAQNDDLLLHLYAYLLDAGTKVNSTKQLITDQLRRYIQEQSQDNKRLIELIRKFEAKTHELEPDPSQYFTDIDSFQAEISALFSRRLFHPKDKEELDSQLDEADNNPDVDLSNLFEVSHIDEIKLQRNINTCLQQNNGQATLAQIIDSNPIQYGLDELLTYIKIACEQETPAHIDEQQSQSISWQTDDNIIRRASLPQITFLRKV
ncbi:MAG: DUF3375 domain-containing protein [Gammaproteobacteria bacterium]|nr:DUF3375 domain-containing protein [Gammaproteobacteria bacterium]